MIVLDLKCERGHSFEGWFASATAFEHQQAHQLICCPSCGDSQVARKPSAPHLQTRPATPPPTAKSTSEQDALETVAYQLRAWLRAEARGMEDVGERFAEEARRIHHGDAEARGIRGKASGGEFRDLIAEGIVVLPVPPEEDFH